MLHWSIKDLRVSDVWAAEADVFFFSSVVDIKEVWEIKLYNLLCCAISLVFVA